MTPPGSSFRVVSTSPLSGRSETVLTRLSQSSFNSEPSALTPLQSQVDGLVTNFVGEAANPRTLAAMMAGGMAYRFGRIGVMAAGEGRLAAAPLRVLSMGLGLGSEVTAFEFTNRTLQTFQSPITDHRSPNLWSWSGPGGWAQGLLSSTLTFGLLKGAGFLSREQNIVLQHAFQSGAMVAGHNTAALFGVGARPEGTLAEQLLHAEATNLQLGAGMALAYRFAPGLHSLERSLDLSLHNRETQGIQNRLAGLFPQEGFATAGHAPSLKEAALNDEPDPSRDPLKNPILAMSMGDPPDGSEPPGSGETGKVPGRMRPEDLEDVTRPDLDISSHRPRVELPSRKDSEGFETVVPVSDLLQRIPEEARNEILEILGFSSAEVGRVNEEDLGRGLGEVFDTHLIHTVIGLESPQTRDLAFERLPQDLQRQLRIVDEAIGLYEYARRSNQREVVEAARNAMSEMTRGIYEDAKEIMIRVMGPHFQLPQKGGGRGDQVIQPHEAVVAIGSGDMMALLALLRHRIAPGEVWSRSSRELEDENLRTRETFGVFSWRTRLLVSARSQEAADEINEQGTYRQNPNLKNIQINHAEDPTIEAVGPLGYKGLSREALHRTVRLQMLNVPSNKLHEVLTEDYIRNLPENAILMEVIGGLIGPENRGIFQPGPNESPTALPYQLIYQALRRYGRDDVTVISGGGFARGKDLWLGQPVKMVFAGRESLRGQAPEAELVARVMAGPALDNGYITASFTHHQHSTELGKALKNVTTLMAGLNAGRLSQRILAGALEMINPQGDYETQIRGPIYRLMEGLLLYNEVGIKASRATYKSEVENDYWRCSDINMEEVLRVFQEAQHVNINNKKDMRAFLDREVVQNKKDIASTRNPKRGIAQAIVEMWRLMGSPYEASEVVPEITEEGVKSLRPLMQLYNFIGHPIERRRLHDTFFDLFESFYLGESPVRPPRIGGDLLKALQWKDKERRIENVPGINPDRLREVLEGRWDSSIEWMEREIGRLMELRRRPGTPLDAPETLWQLEIVRRIMDAMGKGYEVREVEHNPFSKPPYENAILLRLGSASSSAQKYHQVYLRVNEEHVMNRLTNLGMLLRSFEEGSQIKVVLSVEGNIEMRNQFELINTIQRIIGAFANTQKESIEVELSLRTPRGSQNITLTPMTSTRQSVSSGFFDALSPLTERLRASPGGDRVTPQYIRNEGATPSRLLDNVLKRSRVWPMLLDYIGGPIHQGIRSALTRPERSTFIGVYSQGKLAEVFVVYRDSENRPMVLSHSLTSRLAKAEPQQYPELNSIDFYDGRHLGEFLRDYEGYAQSLGQAPLEYRVLSIRSLPLEEALVGQMDGINPAVLWRFLRTPSLDRDELIQTITPFYEKSMNQPQVRESVLRILKGYLDPFFLSHQAEIEADPTYQLLERSRQEFTKPASNPGEQL